MVSTSPWRRAGLIMLIALLLVVDAIALAIQNIRVDPGFDMGTGLQLASLFALIALVHISPTPLTRRLRDVFLLCYLFAGVSLAGALAQYWVAGASRGYHDAIFATIDRAMGFDWVAAYRWTAATPWASKLGKLAYLSIFFSPLVIIASLTLAGNAARAERFILAYAIGLIGTLTIFAIIPTQCALSYHVGNVELYRPITDMTYIGIFEALRAGDYPVIQLGTLNGFVSFPSFHAVGASLMIWASWRQRWIGVPLVAVNFAMLLATPVEGSHYLIDVIAGMVLAAVSVLTTKPVLAWFDRRAAALPATPLWPALARPALPPHQ